MEKVIEKSYLEIKIYSNLKKKTLKVLWITILGCFYCFCTQNIEKSFLKLLNNVSFFLILLVVKSSFPDRRETYWENNSGKIDWEEREWTSTSLRTFFYSLSLSFSLSNSLSLSLSSVRVTLPAVMLVVWHLPPGCRRLVNSIYKVCKPFSFRLSCVMSCKCVCRAGKIPTHPFTHRSSTKNSHSLSPKLKKETGRGEETKSELFWTVYTYIHTLTNTKIIDSKETCISLALLKKKMN